MKIIISKLIQTVILLNLSFFEGRLCHLLGNLMITEFSALSCCITGLYGLHNKLRNEDAS